MLEHLIKLIKKVVNNTNTQFSVNNKVQKTTKKKTNLSFQKIVPQKAIIDKTARVQNLLIKVADFANGTPPSNWTPSRFIYKVGALQLKGIAPQLIKIANQEKDLLKQEVFRYSLIWTLGRCGDATVLPILDQLVKSDEKEYIKRLTLEVYLQLAPASAKEELVQAIKDLLPNEALSILQKEDDSDLSTDQINILFPTKVNDGMPPLFCCYLLAFEQKSLRPFIIDLLKQIPLQYPYFQSIRYIFKAAELRNDFEVLGLLAYRIDTASKNHDTRYQWKWDKSTRKYASKRLINKEAAFSNLTKSYFQKRIIRLLRLFGEQETPEFCDLAINILQHYQDAETTRQEESIGRYSYTNGRSHYQRTDYYFYNTICFPWLTISWENHHVKALWKKNSFRINQVYLRNQKPFPFIKNWHDHPAQVVQLLVACQSEAVAAFALRILEGHAAETQLITKDIFIQLLKSPLKTVADYALTHIQTFFNPRQPEWAILSTFIQTPNEKVRTYFKHIIEQHPTIYYNHTQLIEGAALSLQPEIAEWFQAKGTQFDLRENKKTRIFEDLIYKIQSLKKEEEAQLLYKNSQAFFASQMAQMALPKAMDLLAHPLENVQLLGAGILLSQKEKIAEIDETAILKMMESSFLIIRIKGMELFGAMPIELLLKKKDVLVNMAISKDPEMRAAIQPILAKTANGKSEWATQLLQFFIPILLQKETYEGLHADTLELLVNHLGNHLEHLPSVLNWKLIQSHYREANLLGMELLQYQDFSKAALSDIISLANHEMPTIRQYCFDYFNENIGRIRYESAESLRLLDAKWEDSRQFGFTFFEQHFKGGDWTPELLVSTCDSTRPDVQEFGKKMIVKFFDDGKGEAYLMQLSQHPNVSLQLFATNYLQDFAAGKSENFIRLKPYFKTVLCQLYKGGATKKRIFNFMEKEALDNKEIAKHTIEILNEVSLTMAIRDKARCIQVLYSIKRAYPSLESVLNIETVST